MRIELRGVSLASRLRARIERRLSRWLSRVPTAPVSALVTFVDDNGPKGGRAVRCALTVRVPRRPAFRVESVGETAWLAFDQSFTRLTRRLAEDRAGRLQQKRYPKKYFAARRLLP